MNMSLLKTYSGALLIITLRIIAEASNMGMHRKKAAHVGMILGKIHLKSNQRAAKHRQEHTHKKFHISDSKSFRRDGNSLPCCSSRDLCEFQQLKMRDQAGLVLPCYGSCGTKEELCQQLQSVEDGVKGIEAKFTEFGKRMNEIEANATQSEQTTKDKLDELEKGINSVKSKLGSKEKSDIDIDAKVDSAVKEELDKRMKEIDAAINKSMQQTKDILNDTIRKETNELREEIKKSAQCEQLIQNEVDGWIYDSSPDPNAAFKILNIRPEYKVSLNYRTKASKNYLAIEPSGTRHPEKGLQIYIPTNGSLIKTNIPITVNELYFVEIMQETVRSEEESKISIRVNNSISYTTINIVPGTTRKVLWSQESDPLNAAEISDMTLYHKGNTKQITKKCYWLDGGKTLLTYVGFASFGNIDPRKNELKENMTFNECLDLFRKKHESDVKWSSFVYDISSKECHMSKIVWKFYPDSEKIAYQVS